jgi:hypothetical protein
LTRGWQWKVDLDAGKKSKYDLYDELAKAPKGLAYLVRPRQLEAHKSEARTKQVAGGWRFGKSTWLAAEILPYMFKDDAYIWIVANDYELGRYEFEYVRDWLNWFGVPLIRDSMPGQGAWQVETAWGARLKTQTAADITKMEGAELDAAAIAEAGLMDPDIIRRLRGRVAERRGPILMSGSLDLSEPWYMEYFEKFLKGPVDGQNWHSWGFPSWDNLIVYPGGKDDPEIKELAASMTPDEFKLKVACEVAKPSELVFPEFDKRDHVCEMEFSAFDEHGGELTYPQSISNDFGMTIDRWRLPYRGPVHLAIDPGSRGAYAVLAIRKYDDKIYVIDEVYMRLTMVQDVIAECKTREWWPDVEFAVMDIAGKQQPAMASHADIWALPENLGTRPAMTYIHIEDGINHLKTWLSNPLNHQPRVWFSPKCKSTIKEFASYRYRMEKDNRPTKEEPIDASNHAIKALIYYLFNRFTPGKSTGKTVSMKYVGQQTGKQLGDGRYISDPTYHRYHTIRDWALTYDDNNGPI